MNFKTVSISAVLIVAFLLLGIVTAALITQYMFPQTVTVNNYAPEIWWEDQQVFAMDEFDWGIVMVNEPVATNLTVKNVGTLPFNVTVTYDSLPSGWTLTWAKNNTIIQPNTQAMADLILTPSTTGAETFNLYINILEP
jgi:hypothetical protein